MDPITGGLIASLGNALWGVGSTIAQNKYNSPKAQLKRLRDAGLPLTYMYQGRVNTQSTAPQLSLQPDLGVAKKIELHQQNEMNQGRLREIDKSIQKMGQDIETSAELANKYSTEAYGRYLENKKTDRYLTWASQLSGRVRKDKFGNDYEYANDAEMLELQKNINTIKEWTDNNSGRIRQIVADVEDELYGEGVQAETQRQALKKLRQNITNLVSQDDLLGQMFDIRSLDAALTKALSGSLEGKDDITKGILWALLSVIKKIGL